MMRVAWVGPFSDVNFGDYAMLVNNVFDLNIDHVTLFSYDIQFLSRVCDDYLSGFNADLCEVKINLSLLPDYPNGYLQAPSDCLSAVLNREAIEERIADSDVLVVSGGGYFNELWSQPHRSAKLLSVMVPILLADAQGVKVVFMGNSYGPFGVRSQMLGSFLESLRNATLGCRDDLFSRMWLRQLGVDTRRIKTAPDDLLFVNSLLKASTGPAEDGPYVVMETYLPVSYLEENSTEFATFASVLAERYGLRVVVIPLNVGQGGMDQAEYLASIHANYEVVDIRQQGYLDIGRATALVDGAELVLSSRYHLLVLALGSATPAISVMREVLGDFRYYYNKDAGALRLCLKDVPYRDDLYLQSDYVETMRLVAQNLPSILEQQIENYGDTYRRNMSHLKSLRHQLLGIIWDVGRG